ncbi:MAG: hypothetical protein IPN13_10740 [Bacteroidetes bacterium]|nr:hypothetical protein [Bacteroidota bacterium]
MKDQTVSGIEHKEKVHQVIYKGDFDIDLPVYYKQQTINIHFLLQKQNGRKAIQKNYAIGLKNNVRRKTK